MKEIEEKIQKVFDEMKVGENEKKGLLSVVYIKSEIDGRIRGVGLIEGNKIDLVEVLIMLFKDEKENELQNIFEAVKEFV